MISWFLIWESHHKRKGIWQLEIKGLHNLHKSQEEKSLCIMIARPPKVSIFPHSGLRPPPDRGLDDTGDYDIRLAGLMTLVMMTSAYLRALQHDNNSDDANGVILGGHQQCQKRTQEDATPWDQKPPIEILGCTLSLLKLCLRLKLSKTVTSYVNYSYTSNCGQPKNTNTNTKTVMSYVHRAYQSSWWRLTNMAVICWLAA